jgi:exodeoxyribonuclease V alpha subunit
MCILGLCFLKINLIIKKPLESFSNFLICFIINAGGFMESIKGKYFVNVYSGENGFTIGKLMTEDGNITFQGNFNGINVGDTLELFGEYYDHPKYGFQIKTSDYRKLLPSDKDAMVAYLSSGLFKGIGKKIATKIVNKLKDNIPEKIIENPNVLNSINGLSKAKILAIYHDLKNNQDTIKYTSYLSEIGFTMNEAIKIYETYKQNTISYIQNNVYKISDDIKYIPFSKIDEVGHNLEIAEFDTRRLKALIIYLMNDDLYKNGDTYHLKENIYNLVKTYIHKELDLSIFDEVLKILEVDERITVIDEKYYLTSILQKELNIASTLKYLNKQKEIKDDTIDLKIEKYAHDNKIVYNAEQKNAIKLALTNNLLVITGGPGTGKTTIIKAIVNLASDDKSIMLLAPTGKASRRLSESCKKNAQTIHRFLKWDKENDKFGVDEFNKDSSNFIIIDEVSMLDINIMDSLIKGLNRNISLILVGDYNQLPSVGPGNILKDIIDSNKIKVVHLEVLYRQKENSYINILAHNIKKGILDNYLEKKDDTRFLNCHSENILEALKNVCHNLIQKNISYKNFTVLAPMYAGINGIDNLNIELQKLFNPSKDKKEIVFGKSIFRKDDKVIQLINDNENGVYNGDIGIITSVKTNPKEITIDFDGTIVNYKSDAFINFKHAYATTVHKAQGCEFDIVIILVSRYYHKMLYRKLIYTGITRAKEKLIIIGEPTSFEKAVLNTNEYVRKTSLKSFLE